MDQHNIIAESSFNICNIQLTSINGFIDGAESTTHTKNQSQYVWKYEKWAKAIKPVSDKPTTIIIIKWWPIYLHSLTILTILYPIFNVKCIWVRKSFRSLHDLTENASVIIFNRVWIVKSRYIELKSYLILVFFFAPRMIAIEHDIHGKFDFENRLHTNVAVVVLQLENDCSHFKWSVLIHCLT